MKDSDHPSKYFSSNIRKVSIRQKFPLLLKFCAIRYCNTVTMYTGYVTLYNLYVLIVYIYVHVRLGANYCDCNKENAIKPYATLCDFGKPTELSHVVFPEIPISNIWKPLWFSC